MSDSPRAGRPFAPGYGIVAAEEGEGLLPWSWAEERLARARTYFLSTVRPDGAPHVMPIWGLWLDGAFWFSTGRDSRKAKNLAANPRCVVTPEGAEEAVIVEGAARLAETPHPRWAAEYLVKYAVDVGASAEPAYVLVPSRAFGLVEKSFTKSATRWTFAARGAR